MKTKNLFYFIFITFLTIFTFGKVIKSEASSSHNHVEKTAIESGKELSDDEVLQSMEKILFLFNPELQDQIKLEVHQGVVFLSGIINTLKNQEEAVNILKSVTVKGVIDYSILNPAVCHDKDIKDDISVAFLQNPGTYAPDLEIQILKGAVTLTGPVANSWEKGEAVSAAKGIIGVTTVTDCMNIDSQKKHSRVEWLDIITAMLAQDKYLFDNNLIVKIYHDGRVTLQGSVDTVMEKAYASKIILALGIGEVDNQLMIEKGNAGYIQKGAFDLGDSEIHQSIDCLIQQDERINDKKSIAIQVDDGVVTLQGMVADAYEENILEQDIRSVDGVLFIKNLLIAEEPSRKDASIVQDIKRAIGYESNLAGADITVTCESGKVILNGKIDIVSQKNLVGSLLIKIVGVKEVSNQLRIIASEILVKPAANDNEKLQHGLLKWNLEIGNKTFQIRVDRENETVTIRGEVENWEQKRRAEYILKSRVPADFQIINEIQIP